jgi:hypothetical protein
MIFFLILLGSFRNEVSKVVILKYLCHKTDFLLHACGFFLIWFIAIIALLSLLLLSFGILRVFGT